MTGGRLAVDDYVEITGRVAEWSRVNVTGTGKPDPFTEDEKNKLKGADVYGRVVKTGVIDDATIKVASGTRLDNDYPEYKMKRNVYNNREQANYQAAYKKVEQDRINASATTIATRIRG